MAFVYNEETRRFEEAQQVTVDGKVMNMKEIKAMRKPVAEKKAVHVKVICSQTCD